MAVVGASGSGKSTLLNLMARVDRPTSGKVIIRRRQIGLIYQFYNLIPILNVEEKIIYLMNYLVDNNKEFQFPERL